MPVDNNNKNTNINNIMRVLPWIANRTGLESNDWSGKEEEKEYNNYEIQLNLVFFKYY